MHMYKISSGIFSLTWMLVDRQCWKVREFGHVKKLVDIFSADCIFPRTQSSLYLGGRLSTNSCTNIGLLRRSFSPVASWWSHSCITVIPIWINGSNRSVLGTGTFLTIIRSVFSNFSGLPKNCVGRTSRLLTTWSASPYRQSCIRFKFPRFANSHAVIVGLRLLMNSGQTSASPQNFGRCSGTSFRAPSYSLVIRLLAFPDLLLTSLPLDF